MWLALLGAILAEVGATLSLRMLAHGRRTWIVPVVAGYAVSFGLLALTLHLGLTIGVAYGIWTAVGVAVTALAGHVLFGEPLTALMGLGIALVAAGVLFIEAGATH
ncbi:small multidrug resistance pump [Mumia flava]|uniref:Small multidrug resistance pump n=1 Tax=Mumia flava TaxID=1348852 RepID=A0A0B2B5A2_9ACTN|nr:SMR family transporter [Mumia flava]PJJ54337.1 small multidrug resistance pump [Mumia flava]